MGTHQTTIELHLIRRKWSWIGHTLIKVKWIRKRKNKNFDSHFNKSSLYTPSGPEAHLTFKSEITLISEGNIFLKEEERVGLLT